MKILHAWLTAIFLSTTVWSNQSDLDAKIAQFARSPQWLGHFFYEGTPNVYTSLVESNHYFLSKTGKYNPEDELREVIRRLSSADQITEEHYCHYIGRYEMVLAVFPEYRKPGHTCKAFEDWSQKLSVDEVRLAFATGYMKNPASSFGHLFLKLVSKKQMSESLNYGINFSAQTGADSGAIYALKGLFGEYPGGFSFLPYHQLIKDYSDLEGRDIWELDLNLDITAKKRLLLFIYEFDSNYIDYTFLNNNCAGILERLVYYLQNRDPSRFPSFKPWTIPLESFQDMAAGVEVKNFFYIPSLKTQLAYMDKQLTDSERLNIKEEYVTKNASQLSARELDYVILDKKINETNLDENHYLELMKARSRKQSDTGFEELKKGVSGDAIFKKPRTASLGVLRDDNGIGIDLGFLNDRMIHGRNISEISAFNFHIRTADQTEKLILKKAEIFSFLAAESINFIRKPISYGGGLFYRDGLDMGVQANAGYVWEYRNLIYYPKLQFNGDKIHTEIAPELDILYFSKLGNWKLNISYKDLSIEYFKSTRHDFYINFVVVHDKKTLSPDTRFGVVKFF